MPALPDWLTRENVALACLFMGTVAFFAYLTYAARRDDLIRFTDVLTGDNGRLASPKVIHVMAFGLTAWGMIWLTISGSVNATEWTLFGGTWGGLALGSKFAPATQKPPAIPPQDGQP